MLSDGLLALDADLLTLQETIVDNGYDQAADMLDSRYEIIYQQDRESDGQGISTASRWPVGEIIELDINVTSRTAEFAGASLIIEILALPPLERIWLVNNLPGSVPGVPGLACWPRRPAGAARPARLAAGWFPPAAPGRA